MQLEKKPLVSTHIEEVAHPFCSADICLKHISYILNIDCFCLSVNKLLDIKMNPDLYREEAFPYHNQKMFTWDRACAILKVGYT